MLHEAEQALQDRRILLPRLSAFCPPGVSFKNSLFGAGGVIRRFLPLTYVSTLRAKSAAVLAGQIGVKNALGFAPLSFNLTVGLTGRRLISLCQRQRSHRWLKRCACPAPCWVYFWVYTQLHVLPG